MTYPSVEPTIPPTQPMADGPRAPKRPWLRALVVDFARFVAVLVCCIAALILVVQPYLREWQDDVERAEVERRVAEERAEALLEEIALGIEIMTPPTNDKLFTILTKGVAQTEYAVKTSTIGTTPTSAFTTDLTTFQQTDAWTQEFTIKNLDESVAGQELCWKPILWASAGANCAAKCAAAVATITCTGAATDGANLAPGESISRRFDGTSCVCVVADTAATAFQTERIVR